MSSAGQYLVFDSSDLSTVLLLWGIYIKKCISPVRICLQTRNARNASTKFRKTSESKKAEKSLEISAFDTVGRVFAFGEDSLALRLASELADLRAANADRRRLHGSVRIVTIPAKRKATPKGGFSLVMCVRFRCKAVLSRFRCTRILRRVQ